MSGTTVNLDTHFPSPRTSKHASLIAILDRWSPGHLLSTIRARLYAAFGVTASLTVVCSLFSLYAFNSIGETTTEIASRNLPATVHSLRLAEESADLVASAPRLMAVSDKQQRITISDEIRRLVQNIGARIKILQEFNRDQGAALQDAHSLMADRLEALDRAVAERNANSNSTRVAVLAVRQTHDAFLEAITPMLHDANFHLMTADPANNGRSKERIGILHALLEMQAQINLLAGLLIEASMATDVARLQPLREMIDTARRRTDAGLNTLPDAQRQKLVALCDQFARLAGQDGLIETRIAELTAQAEAQAAFNVTQSTASRLRGIVDMLVGQEQINVQNVVERGRYQIESGRALLVTLSLVSILVAGLVAWLYVGRNIARRLGVLSQAMQRIADGELTVKITRRWARRDRRHGAHAPGLPSGHRRRDRRATGGRQSRPGRRTAPPQHRRRDREFREGNHRDHRCTEHGFQRHGRRRAVDVGEY